MAGEDFLKFNNGQKFSFSSFKEIKEEDLKNADAETKRLFNIFAGDDHILQANEAQSLWNKIQTAASSNKKGDNSVFDNEEIQNFLDTDANIKADSSNTKFSINALTNIVSQIFVEKESPTNVPSQKATPEQVAKACQETVIGIIDDNISEAEEIFQSQSLGSISGAYDDNKDDNDRLKTSNVRKVLDYQKAGEIQMIEAKNGNLTKRAYYEENKQRIKDMILTRLTVLESSTGVNFLDQHKGKYTKEQLEQIISDYVDTICNNVEMDKLKAMQKQFVSFSVVEEISALDNFVNNAIDYSKNHSEIKLDTMGGEGKPMTIKNPKGIIPSYWDSAEPITFEEVYKTERGVEYSQYKVEQYVLAKKKMETVANAFNKKQQFTDAAKAIVDNKELSVDEKLQQIMTLYSEFYALCDDNGLGELQKIIDSSNTLIKLNENGLDLSAYQNNEQMKQSALNKLLKTAISQKEADFEKFLGGKTIEEYQAAMENAAKDILGEDNAKMLSEAMKNDNMTVIQRWTGNASMAGMGMTVVGGILCFTPLAPLGAALVTVGNVTAIGGMVAKTGLGVADYATKDVQTTEELTDLAKDFVMDAGGFIVGMGAGKAGMKAFSKLIDKKLAAVFTKEITAGNRMQALKTVLKNPEYLKNFMTAAGAKISTDFMISYVGDLAMMGLLDTDDDWQSLLQANLTGILVGTSGDVKDLAGVGKSAIRGKTKATSGTTSGKPLTQQDYAMSVLGKDVTVKDPATGAKVEGSVTKVTNENGVVKVEVNGKEYSTDDVIAIKDNNLDLREENINNNQSPLILRALTPAKLEEIECKLRDIDNPTQKFEYLQKQGLIPTDLSDKDISIIKNILQQRFGYNSGHAKVMQLLMNRAVENNTTFSKQLELMDKILKLESVQGDNFIMDATGLLRLPSSIKQLDILECLINLRETCDNPLLNIDNMVHLSCNLENITDLNLLVKRFEAKNADGTYKYTIDDYSKYDIDPKIKDVEINQIKQRFIEKYKDNQEMVDLIEAYYSSAYTDKQDFGLGTRRERLKAYIQSVTPEVILKDIESGLAYLKNGKHEKFLSIINSAMDKANIENLPLEERIQKLRGIRDVIDIYNSHVGNYETLFNTQFLLGVPYIERSIVHVKHQNKFTKLFKKENTEDDFIKSLNKSNMSNLYAMCDNLQNPAIEIFMKKGYDIRSVFEMLGSFSKDNIESINNLDWTTAITKVDNIKSMVCKQPEQYVNGRYDSPEVYQKVVENFFKANELPLTKLSMFVDKETLNILMRKRFDDVKEYLDITNDFNAKDMVLLQNLCESCNIDGKPFMPTQKIEFIDLINAYKTNGLATTKIEEMAGTGKIDLAQLHIDLFNQIMKNSGLTDEEIASIPKEKLVAWDTKYAHLLSKEINSEKDIAFQDVLRAGNLEPDFMAYIHNRSNVYGQANVETRNRYEQLGMNYDRWIQPSKSNEVVFITKDTNTEQLEQVAAQIAEDMNTLMQTPVKGFLKKQFPKFIKGDEFIIPNEYLSNKTKLQELVKILSDTSEQGQLATVWNRAKSNSENPDPKRAATARGTLTILDHLNQRLSDIENVSDIKAEKERNWTVKMWDRNPQKDIFQGNYSTCCIGMGGGNGSAMPHFVMNTAYNMIEIVDNVSGKTIGNALCYFITGADGKPAFIVDNIEINNGAKPSDNVGIQLRDAIVQYAANVSEEVTGSKNTPIYMSSSYNDVPCADLARHNENISFLGDIDCDEIYMDLYNGWVDKSELQSNIELLRLK